SKDFCFWDHPQVELSGQTMGIVGLGRIGSAVAASALAFGMRVLAYDPYVDSATAATEGVSLCDLDDVIGQADFLSLHMPATPETYRIMDAARIARMKDGAYLLNLSRGPLVDPAALLDALERGKLAGAGLDVFDPEPPALDDRLRDHPDVIATPHSATLTYECRLRMERMAMERVLAFARGERPDNVVNPGVYG
ncbi:MAG: NAD(P)-dependent oxidoreductase, partial [Anaerolineae bacterium]